MFYLVGILVFLYIALRLVYKKGATNLNHKKTFNIKGTKKK